MRRYALRDQVGSPVSEGECLAGAGPGDNEQGRTAVPDRLLLGGVQLPGVPGGDVADLGLGWCLLHEDGSRYSISRGSGSGQPPGVHTRTGLRETIIEVGRSGREGRGSGDDALSRPDLEAIAPRHLRWGGRDDHTALGLALGSNSATWPPDRCLMVLRPVPGPRVVTRDGVALLGIDANCHGSLWQGGLPLRAIWHFEDCPPLGGPRRLGVAVFHGEGARNSSS